MIKQCRAQKFKANQFEEFANAEIGGRHQTLKLLLIQPVEPFVKSGSIFL
jgi:hypothetical protein